jgi:hypothetical protein
MAQQLAMRRYGVDETVVVSAQDASRPATVLRARSYDEDGIEAIDDRKARFVAAKAHAPNGCVGGGLE